MKVKWLKHFTEEVLKKCKKNILTVGLISLVFTIYRLTTFGYIYNLESSLKVERDCTVN